jgi:SAM-dependent methyltransferase
MTTLDWTGERYLPWGNDPSTSYEHWHRYAYASQFTRGKKVLDLASGEGYGSALLAQTAQWVVGLDVDERAVQHAHKKYSAGNLLFIVGSVLTIPLDKIRFDVITCFEAIEHIKDPEKLVNAVQQLLAPDGLFLVSTPNKPEYKKVEAHNPFHINELTFEEFNALLSRYFRWTQYMGQRVYCNSSLWPIAQSPSKMVREYWIDRDAGGFHLADDQERTPLYFIGMASNSETLPELPGSVLVDGSNSLLKERERIQNETAAKALSLESALAWKEEQLQQSQVAIRWREEQAQQLQLTLHSQEQALTWRDEQAQQFEATIHSQKQALTWRETQVADHKQSIEFLRGEITAIQASQAWKIAQKFLQIRDRLFPQGSHRRNLYDRFAGRDNP